MGNRKHLALSSAHPSIRSRAMFGFLRRRSTAAVPAQKSSSNSSLARDGTLQQPGCAKQGPVLAGLPLAKQGVDESESSPEQRGRSTMLPLSTRNQVDEPPDDLVGGRTPGGGRFLFPSTPTSYYDASHGEAQPKGRWTPTPQTHGCGGLTEVGFFF